MTSARYALLALAIAFCAAAGIAAVTTVRHVNLLTSSVQQPIKPI
jgi:hypothetical protein